MDAAKRLAHVEPSATHVGIGVLSAGSPSRSSRLTSREGQRFEERQHQGPRFHRLLCRADSHVSRLVRVPRARTRSPTHPTLQRHRGSVRAVDRPAIGQRLSLRVGSKVPHPGPRQDLWRGLRSSSVSVGCAHCGGEGGCRVRPAHVEPSATHIRPPALSTWSSSWAWRLRPGDGQCFEERQVLRDRWDRAKAVMRARLEDFEEEHFLFELGLLVHGSAP